MKVFILGVTGETGSRLARSLKERGDAVGGLYRRTAPEGVAGIQGDLARMDAAALAEAVAAQASAVSIA